MQGWGLQGQVLGVLEGYPLTTVYKGNWWRLSPQRAPHRPLPFTTLQSN